jgi:hypothetical protein
MADKPLFRLCNLTPVGYKVPNYPSEICLVCRAPLLGVCVSCDETHNEICSVAKADGGNFYHEHCMALLKK